MKKLLLILFLFFISVVIFAQAEGASSSYNPASIYLYSGTLSGTEQLKIKTYIWGQVKKPGLYIVPDNTDLLTLISSAGGPTENAKLTKVKIVRSTKDGEKVIWINLKKYLETGDENLIPIMKPGDTVVISGSTYYAFTKAVDWLSQIAIMLSVYVAISNIN
ncbi:MAG: SLBB domain-containing protein [Candidatus Cloacimonetes bacterium]|nr:SLBB domain-containing protein [Candidatus Cloacimonadota bacterium]